MTNQPFKLNNEISKLQKSHDALMTKYEHTLLDFKKVKLDAQEERPKFKEQIFSLRQKVASFESELNNLKHKDISSRAEYDDVCRNRQERQEELDRIEKEIQKLEDQS